MFQPSHTEKELYLQLVTQAMRVKQYADFLALLKNEVRQLFPFKLAILGMGYLTPTGTVQPHRLISIDFPVDYLKAIGTADGGFTSPTMKSWMQHRVPQFFDVSRAQAGDWPQDWLDTIRRYGLTNMASHGVHDLQGRCTSYFCFCNLPDSQTEQHAAWLEMVIPILHASLLKVIDQVPPLGIEPALSEQSFTPREAQLLSWVAAGKSQKEIAAGLYLSRHTVRNHLNRLYAKLGVHKATEAIERAKILGLI